MGIEDLNHIEVNLTALLDLGKLQVGSGKELLNKPVTGGPRHNTDYMKVDGLWIPTTTGMAMLQTDPKIFFYQTVDQYWTLFEHALSILDKPALQFVMRPMMEMAYSRILLFSSKTEQEQRQIGVKFWLSTLGLLIMSKPINGQGIMRPENYNELVKLLINPAEQKTFSDLAQKGYPKITFHKILAELLPTVMDPAVCGVVNNSLDRLWGGKAPKGESLDVQFRYMSMLTHANPMMVGHLDAEKENFDYLLRCAKIMHLTGVSIIKLCEIDLGWKAVNANKLKIIQNDFGQFLFELWSNKTQPIR